MGSRSRPGALSPQRLLTNATDCSVSVIQRLACRGCAVRFIPRLLAMSPGHPGDLGGLARPPLRGLRNRLAWTPGSAALLRTLPSLGTPSQALHRLAPFPPATAADPRDVGAHLLPSHAPRLHRGPPGPRPPPRNAPPSCGPRSPFTRRPPDCRRDPNWPCSSAACSGLSGGSPQDRPPHPGSRAARTPPGPGLWLSPPPARGLRLCGQPATPPAPSPRANPSPRPRGPATHTPRALSSPPGSAPPLAASPSNETRASLTGCANERGSGATSQTN